jgi:hypothetical protein
MRDAGMPMPALGFSMPMPSYDILYMGEWRPFTVYVQHVGTLSWHISLLFFSSNIQVHCIILSSRNYAYSLMVVYFHIVRYWFFPLFWYTLPSLLLTMYSSVHSKNTGLLLKCILTCWNAELCSNFFFLLIYAVFFFSILKGQCHEEFCLWFF